MKILVMFAAFLVMSAGAAMADDPAKVMVLPASRGDVTFEHQKHMQMKDSCAPCHATDKGGKIEGFGKDMAHLVCKGCHADQKAGPTGCKDCHH